MNYKKKLEFLFCISLCYGYMSRDQDGIKSLLRNSLVSDSGESTFVHESLADASSGWL